MSSILPRASRCSLRTVAPISAWPDISPAALKSPVDVVAAMFGRSLGLSVERSAGGLVVWGGWALAGGGGAPAGGGWGARASCALPGRGGSAARAVSLGRADHGPVSVKTWPRQDSFLYLYSGLALSSSLVMLTMTFSPLSVILRSDHAMRTSRSPMPRKPPTLTMTLSTLPSLPM